MYWLINNGLSFWCLLLTTYPYGLPGYNSYASEHQTVVNGPIYNANLYLMYSKHVFIVMQCHT